MRVDTCDLFSFAEGGREEMLSHVVADLSRSSQKPGLERLLQSSFQGVKHLQGV